MDRSGSLIRLKRLWQARSKVRGKKAPALLAAGLVLLAAYWFSLPQQLFEDSVSPVLFSSDGHLLGARIAKDQQWRFPGSETVPEKFKTALIVYEDKRFYSHPGVDPLAFARAMVQNIKNKKVVSGGSTLTMQLLRLSRKNPPRTYFEKIKEMILATRLELKYDKDRILALYAANAPFGGNIVGLDTAAWRYYGRSAQELSWAESAMLAVLPNNPSMIHPGRNRDALLKKRNRLLSRLHEQGSINNMQLQLAKAESLVARPKPIPQHASHLLSTLIKRYPGKARFESHIQFYRQLQVNEQVASHSQWLGEQGIDNAAVLVIDNKSFDVVAYVGNSPAINANRGHSVDLIHRARSTGSVLKPLLFASMLQQGEILPTTLIPDIPTRFGSYKPENYDRDYRGAVQAKEALARSLNIPAVYMLQRHGIARFQDTLKNMGMSTLFRRPDEYGLSLILGGAEGNLWELTQIYANLAYIARQQVSNYNRPYLKANVLKKEGRNTQATWDIQAGAAWLTFQALQEVNRPGAENNWRNFSSSQKIAWKTGTSYGLRDGWAIGSNRRYTVGVWVGNATGEGKAGLTGLGAAAPLLFDVFNSLPQTPWFKKPEALLAELRVCRRDGLLDNGNCETETQYTPVGSGFNQLSWRFKKVHMDSKQHWRVHSRCEKTYNMRHRNWFVLPPVQAYFYKRFHVDYQALPEYRPDCRNNTQSQAKAKPFELEYPHPGAKIYIPTDLGERREKTLLQARHNDPETVIYWHLNEEYLGETRFYHQMALDVPPGRYRLTLVDQKGNSLKRSFEILGLSKTAAYSIGDTVSNN